MSLTRRELLLTFGGATLATSIGLLHHTTSISNAQSTSKTKDFRLVFLTDIHLRSDLRSPEGMAACLDAVEKLSPKPDFIITGGDLIQNLRDQGLEEGNKSVDLFAKIWQEHTSIPVYHMLGNHDPASWRKGDIPPDHPQYGWKMLMTKLGMDKLYYSFDHGGWHFVVLHDVVLTESGKFIAEFSEGQLTFLKADLKQHREQPTLIFCHVPPLTVTEFLGGRAKVEEGKWTLGVDRMATNATALMETMGEGEGNVKAVFSGHIHTLDRIEINGYTFYLFRFGKWSTMDRPLRGVQEGFGIIDCKGDGTYSYQYYDYGWEAPAPEPKPS